MSENSDHAAESEMQNGQQDLKLSQPAPMITEIGEAILPDGQSAITLTLHSVNGTNRYFLPDQNVVQLAQALLNLVKARRSRGNGGLIVPDTETVRKIGG